MVVSVLKGFASFSFPMVKCAPWSCSMSIAGAFLVLSGMSRYAFPWFHADSV